MTDHQDCVPRAALLRLAEEMEASAAAAEARADGLHRVGVRDVWALRAACNELAAAVECRRWATHVRAVAGLPPRAPTVDLTAKEGKP